MRLIGRSLFDQIGVEGVGFCPGGGTREVGMTSRDCVLFDIDLHEAERLSRKILS